MWWLIKSIHLVGSMINLVRDVELDSFFIRISGLSFRLYEIEGLKIAIDARFLIACFFNQLSFKSTSTARASCILLTG